jgi:hypothetical protein
VHRIQFADPVSFLKQNRGFSLFFSFTRLLPNGESKRNNPMITMANTRLDIWCSVSSGLVVQMQRDGEHHSDTRCKSYEVPMKRAQD